MALATLPSTKEEFVEEAKRTLGWPVVGVELADENWEAAWRASLRWYMAHKGQTKYTTILLSSDIQEYTLPDDCDEVTSCEVRSGSAVNDYWGEFGWPDIEIFPYEPFANESVGFYSYLYQRSQFYSDKETILSANKIWFYRKDQNKIYILRRPSDGASAYIMYKTKSVNLALFTSLETEIFMDYFLGWTKYTYGRILNKHQSFPGASGDKMLDGADLRMDAVEQMKKATEDLHNINAPMPIVIA